MGKTNIQWTDYVFNPWRGCRKVSPGCKNCYIDRTPIFRVTKQKHEDRVRGSVATLAAPFAWNKKPWICDVCGKAFGSAEKPGSKYRNCWHDNKASYHRARVFLGSLMDIFDDEIPIEWFAKAMDVVRQCQDLDFLLVTKRPELAMRRLADAKAYASTIRRGQPGMMPLALWLVTWVETLYPPRNVWVITSTENQEMLVKRVPELLKIPAVVHGLSCEPLLAPLNFDGSRLEWLAPFKDTDPMLNKTPRIDWIVAGGESGPEARPCNIDWMRSIQFQCKSAGVAYFAKQLGANVIFDNPTDPAGASYAGKLKDKKGGEPSEWPEDMRVRQWPESQSR